MKIQSIGGSTLNSTRLSYGCMRISGTWNPSEVTSERVEYGKAAVLAAYEAGYTLYDHADIYCRGECERIFGLVLKDIPSMRNEIVIATKCGIRFPGEPNPDSPHRYDFSAEHILKSCDASLERLKVDTIDIYQLHRPDLLMDPEEIARAFDTLHRQGKVRYFGVSNFVPSFVRALQSGLSAPLIVNQVEVHLGRLDCFTDGTLDQCIAENITPLSWSPLGGGFLGEGSKLDPKHPRYEVLSKLQAACDEIAKKHGVNRTIVAISWLLKHPSKIIPIIGSANPAHIKDAVRADSFELDREEWYRLLVAARGEGLP